jgi:hypothetical protein
MKSIGYKIFTVPYILARAVQYHNMNANKTFHLWEDRLVTGNKPCSMFNEAQIDIRFHTPRNLWKRLAWRRDSETGE